MMSRKKKINFNSEMYKDLLRPESHIVTKSWKSPLSH